jgi:N-acetylglucosamine-6-sulfatase
VKTAPARLGVHALAIVLIAAALAGISATRADAQRSQPPPNFLFVLTDDLAAGDEAYMPNTQELVADTGATFGNYFVSDSVCCPSRVTTLRGQFAHNTGVKTNGGSNGGFDTAYTSGVEHDTIATTLQAAGYRTGLFGKYLNKYPGVAGERYIPPGWSAWSSPVAGDPYKQHDYVLNHNGRLEPHGNRSSDHADGVFVDQTQRFIERAAKDRVPFFAYVNVYAPHSPAHPADVDRGTFAGLPSPRTAAYDQADVSRMPTFIRSLPQFDAREEDAITRLHRRRIETLQSVDRGIARLVTTLQFTKQLDNTYVIFTSDNGFHLGDHRLPGGKGTAYDTDIKVPLFVSGPGIAAGAHPNRFAGNVDLAPTIAELAGVDAAEFTDGRSLVPLLKGEPTPAWRTRYLVEHWHESGEEGDAPRLRKGTLEPSDLDAGKPGATGSVYGKGPIDDKSLLARYGRIPDYSGVRTSRYLYVEYANGDRELYNVREDPSETVNLAGTKPATEESLARKLARLRDCRAQACRDADRGPVNDL